MVWRQSWALSSFVIAILIGAFCYVGVSGLLEGAHAVRKMREGVVFRFNPSNQHDIEIAAKLRGFRIPVHATASGQTVLEISEEDGVRVAADHGEIHVLLAPILDAYYPPRLKVIGSVLFIAAIICAASLSASALTWIRYYVLVGLLATAAMAMPCITCSPANPSGSLLAAFPLFGAVEMAAAGVLLSIRHKRKTQVLLCGLSVLALISQPFVMSAVPKACIFCAIFAAVNVLLLRAAAAFGNEDLVELPLPRNLLHVAATVGILVIQVMRGGGAFPSQPAGSDFDLLVGLPVSSVIRGSEVSPALYLVELSSCPACASAKHDLSSAGVKYQLIKSCGEADIAPCYDSTAYPLVAPLMLSVGRAVTITYAKAGWSNDPERKTELIGQIKSISAESAEERHTNDDLN